MFKLSYCVLPGLSGLYNLRLMGLEVEDPNIEEGSKFDLGVVPKPGDSHRGSF